MTAYMFAAVFPLLLLLLIAYNLSKLVTIAAEALMDAKDWHRDLVKDHRRELIRTIFNGLRCDDTDDNSAPANHQPQPAATDSRTWNGD